MADFVNLQRRLHKSARLPVGGDVMDRTQGSYCSGHRALGNKEEPFDGAVFAAQPANAFTVEELPIAAMLAERQWAVYQRAGLLRSRSAVAPLNDAQGCRSGHLTYLLCGVTLRIIGRPTLEPNRTDLARIPGARTTVDVELVRSARHLARPRCRVT